MLHRRHVLALATVLTACGAPKAPASDAAPGSGGEGGESAASTTSSSATATATSSVSSGAGGAAPTPYCAGGETFGDSLVEEHRPAYDGSGEPPDVLAIEVVGPYLYECTAQAGFVIAKRDDPTQIVGSVDGAGRCEHLALDGDTVLVSNRGDSTWPTPAIARFDVSDPEHPVAMPGMTFVDEGGKPTASPEGLAVLAEGLYAAAMHGDGVWILSASELPSLAVVTKVFGLANAQSFARLGDRLYVADGAAGVAVLDISDPSSPVLLGHTPLAGSALALDVGDGALYVAAGAGGVHVLDLASPDAPAPITTIDTPGSAVDVAYDDQHVLVADWNDVRAYEVTDRAAPVLVGVEAIDTSFELARVLSVAAADGHVFAGEWTGVFDDQLFPCRAAPDIRAPRLPVHFARTAPGAESAYSIVLANEGRIPLSITSIVSDSDVFRPQQTSLLVAPGERDFIEVRFKPLVPSVATATLTLTTDDPDEGVVTIALDGNLASLTLGDAIPSWTWQTIPDGQTVGTDALHGQVIVLSYFATF